MLYAVDGVTPETFANSLIFIFRCLHKFSNRFATASLTLVTITSRNLKNDC